MATDQASESLPDQLSSFDRVEEWAFRLRISTDILLGILRRHDVYLNPGDRVPGEVVFAKLQAELDEGRAWPVERLLRVT